MAIKGKNRLPELVECPGESDLCFDHRQTRDISRCCGIVNPLKKPPFATRRMWVECGHLKGTVIAEISNYEQVNGLKLSHFVL